MIIDPHLHVWSDDVETYPFAGEAQPGEPATAELLIENMDRAGVDGAVIVQPAHYLFDNRYVADCLKRFPGKFAGQGLVDPTKTGAADRLESLVKEHGFTGIRIHVSRYGDPADLTGPDQDPLWERAQALNAPFNLFGRSEDYPAMDPIIARFPGVNVVIDHIAGVPADEPAPNPLLNNLLKWGTYPNVFVKISNVGRVSKTPYPHRDTFGMIKRIYDAYGPERLMWGTDFPHILRSPGYTECLELIRDHMDFWNQDDLDWILCKTILKLWPFESES